MGLDLKHKVAIVAGVIGGLAVLYYLTQSDSESVGTPRMSELDMKLLSELKKIAAKLEIRPDGVLEFESIYDLYQLICRHIHFVTEMALREKI